MYLLIKRCVGRWPFEMVLIKRAQWSGADYADSLIKTVTGGVSSTAAMGRGVTETQFGAKL
jgi:isocitrate lyase